MSDKPFDFKDYIETLRVQSVQDMIMHATEDYGLVVVPPEAFMQALNDTYLEQIIVPTALVELLARTRKPLA